MAPSFSGEFAMQRKNWTGMQVCNYYEVSFRIRSDGGELGLPTHRRPASKLS